MDNVMSCVLWMKVIGDNQILRCTFFTRLLLFGLKLHNWFLRDNLDIFKDKQNDGFLYHS